MAPLMDDVNGIAKNVQPGWKPRFAVVGAGSRGNAYARTTVDSGLGEIACVVEPIRFKRELFGSKYIWQKGQHGPGQTFADLGSFIEYEQQRRRDAASNQNVSRGVDGVYVCVRDELHLEVLTALAPLNLHMLCEKPLATSLQDCLQIQRLLNHQPQRIFAIGHVLRYSPHNMLLRQLVLEDNAIGEVLSIEHTEPVGWWHFSHSYVRGNWRKESYTAPSLLTKSCHDIDWLLWMLCSPPRSRRHVLSPHLPSTVVSTGSLKQFRRARKPVAAGSATNCLSCPIKDTCIYSAPRIYYDRRLAKGVKSWPVNIVNPEVETLAHSDNGSQKAKEALLRSLAEDYDANSTAVADIESRGWYGRCVWESDNDVVDDQHVLFEWESEHTTQATSDEITHRNAKSASFHMVAQTLAQCDRRGHIYGTSGEIAYDSHKITVHDFTNDSTRELHPEVPVKSHHGGGDEGLTQQFLRAVNAVEQGKMDVRQAQVEFLDVTLEDAIRSHAAVFAAEDARREARVVRWGEWWERNVAPVLAK